MKNQIGFAAAGDILITKRIPGGNQGIPPIQNFMKRADVRMANLETTITDGSCFASAFSGGTWLTADKNCLRDIRKYGFDMLALANNHTMDYSYRGLEMTLQTVREAGFFYAGAGRNLYEASRPVMIETDAGRVGILNICSTFEDAARAGSQTERMPGRPGLNVLRFHTVYRVTAEHADILGKIGRSTGINSLRNKHRAQGFLPPLKEGVQEFGTYEFEIVDSEEKEGRFSRPDQNDMARTLKSIKEAAYTCEAVIVMVHSHEIKGNEEWEADFFLEEFSRRCIDAGASAVIGSGTHQMKGIEFYKERPIFYCLGNFIFENSFVQDLPADFMEKYGLPAETSAAEGLAAREKNAAGSLHLAKEVFQTVIPYFEISGEKCTQMELLPVSLGFNRPEFEKNLPYPASKTEAVEITAYLNRACRRYGVRWKYEKGRIIPDD